MNEQSGELEALRIDRGQGRASRRGRRRSSWAGWVVLLVLAATAGGGLYLFRHPLLDLLDRWRLPRVQVIRVEETSAVAVGAIEGTAANGYIVAARRAALSADTPGRIVALHVEEGSVVTAGQVVAELYSEEYEAALRRAEAELEATTATLEQSRAQLAAAHSELERLQSTAAAAASDVEAAQASLELAASDLRRTRELEAERIETERQVEEATANHTRAQAQLQAAQAREQAAGAAVRAQEQQILRATVEVTATQARQRAAAAARDLARATLAKTKVKAPFDGVIILKDAEVGEVVSPSTGGGSSTRGSVVTMVDFDSLEAQVELPETSLEAVSIGAPATIFLDAYPDDPYPGRVDRLWPTANRQKGTVEVRVAFERRDQRLRPEMGLRVVFAGLATSPAQASTEGPRLVVPEGALVRQESRAGVLVVERGIVHFRAVTTGAARGGQVAVTQGLEGGEEVVLDPPPRLQDGDRIIRQED